LAINREETAFELFCNLNQLHMSLYSVCAVPAAPVYRSNHHTHEMINQVLFGEFMQVVEMQKHWTKIKTLHDGYEGWVLGSQLMMISEQQATELPVWVLTNRNDAIQIEDGLMNIPVGSSLPGYNGRKGELGELSYEYSGTNALSPDDRLMNKDVIGKLALNWQNAPYLWGGRTLMGVDCSGFTQVIFKVGGVSLLRDAHQQALQGRVVDFLQEAVPGDLAFFDNEEGQIIHVGILLSGSEIIHAFGKVRIDTIDNAGIINRTTGLRTHRLRIIKRYV
jgi:gamma-D-glutamyl-L-lysine dipeptidyl-peptidase